MEDDLVVLRPARRPIERLDVRLPLIAECQLPQLGPQPVARVGAVFLWQGLATRLDEVR
jgi:hypothetical protein